MAPGIMCFRDKKSSHSNEGKGRSDHIDRVIKADKRKKEKEVKILLLGTGLALFVASGELTTW